MNAYVSLPQEMRIKNIISNSHVSSNGLSDYNMTKDISKIKKVNRLTGRGREFHPVNFRFVFFPPNATKK